MSSANKMQVVLFLHFRDKFIFSLFLSYLKKKWLPQGVRVFLDRGWNLCPLHWQADSNHRSTGDGPSWVTALGDASSLNVTERRW